MEEVSFTYIVNYIRRLVSFCVEKDERHIILGIENTSQNNVSVLLISAAFEIFVKHIDVYNSDRALICFSRIKTIFSA